MQPISSEVETIIMRWPLVEEGMTRGILNLSALARDIRPEVEKVHMQPVSEASIVMALKRIAEKWGRKHKFMRLPIDLQDVTVRTSLTEFIFFRPSDPTRLHRSLVGLMEKTEQTMNYSQGIYETTVFAKSNLEKEIDALTKDERLKRKMPHLCSITIRISQDTAAIPGVYYSVLRTLAWENINLIEVLSVDSELTLFFEENMVDRAFSLIKKFAIGSR